MKTKTFSLCIILFVLLLCTTVAATEEVENNTTDLNGTNITDITGEISTNGTIITSEKSVKVDLTDKVIASNITKSKTADEVAVADENNSAKGNKTSNTNTTLNKTEKSETLNKTTTKTNYTKKETKKSSKKTYTSKTYKKKKLHTKSKKSTTNYTSTVDAKTLEKIEKVNKMSSLANDTLGESSIGKINYTISGKVSDAYNVSSKTYVGGEEDGIPVEGANVTVYDSAGTIVGELQTNSTGDYQISGLSEGNYSLIFNYNTYLAGNESVRITNKSKELDYIFVPDIVIISYSGSTETDGQRNKVEALQNISSRVAFIESYNLNSSYETTTHWMLDYSNFILVDMFSQGNGFGVDIDLIGSSPASNNYKIAYTFGIYSDYYFNQVLKTWNFIGGSPYSIENTYIGSYWQAETITDQSIVNSNMQNFYDYIIYLLGESDVNPTTNGNSPVLANPSWGLYHPDYGLWGRTPEKELINQWILEDPGYNDDNSGSLNWMTNEYAEWSAEHNNPAELFAEYESWYNKNKDINGSFIALASYFAGGSLMDAMMREYENQGRAVVNVFQRATVPSMTDLLHNMTVGDIAFERGVVAVSSLYSFSMDYANMGGNKTTSAYKDMNVSVLKALDAISKSSYLSEFGPQAEWTYAVTVPQFEGVFGAVPVSYLDENGTEIIIQSGLEKSIQLTNGWARLKELNNSDKKIAILLYNYPPGKANIGASYLDVFQSLHDLLVNMAQAGYDIGMDVNEIPSTDELYTLIAEAANKGSWAQGLLDQYVEKYHDELTAKGQLINKTTYESWISDLPQELVDSLYDCWGDPFINYTHTVTAEDTQYTYNGTVNNMGKTVSMLYNNDTLVVPGTYFGNVFISVQPARGWEEVTNYHNTSLSPPPAYVAFYEYLNKVYDADAVISMGTHGTLEWLPGHTLGMQESDWSFQFTECPIIYPYIVSNPGEGMTAKERSFAQVITHMTPVMTDATLYGDYVVLEDYVTRYDDAIKNDATSLLEQYQIEIVNLATSLGYDNWDGNYTTLNSYMDKYNEAIASNNTDLIEEYRNNILETASILEYEYDEYENGTFENWITQLSIDNRFMEYNETFDEWLSRLHSQIESMDSDVISLGLHSLGYIWNDTEMITGVFTIASSRTEALQDIMANLYPILADADYYELVKDRSFAPQDETIKSVLTTIISLLVEGNTVDEVGQLYGLTENDALYKDIGAINEIIVDIQNNLEIFSVMNALAGGYVEPGLSADPSYSDVLPTGRSLYSSDTSKMPSKTAFKTAQAAVDGMLRTYYENNAGSWPDITGIVIWGTEVLRTEGISLAEFLYFLGVTPVWDNTGTVTGVELIPIENLTITLSDGSVVNRPRVDVFTTIVSTNPAWLKMLNDAVALANATNETSNQNFVKKHYNESPTLDRVFGLEGAVLEGTGVSDLAPNVADWQDSANGISYELASVYLSRISHSWTVDENGKIVVTNATEAFNYLVSHVTLLTQNLDSSWRVLDSDDYADWFGGLLNAANILGANPNTQLLDIRDKNNINAFTLQEEIQKEIRTGLLNPQYTDALQTSASGWTSLSEKLENMMKWTFTTQGYSEDKKGNAIQVERTGNNAGVVGSNLFGQLSKALASDQYAVNKDYAAYSFQSMAGWMLTTDMLDFWDADDDLRTKLANKYVEVAVQYGIACCHHTCKNIVFNSWIVKVATVPNDLKKQYSDMMAASTSYKGPLYDDSDATNTIVDGDETGEVDISDIVSQLGGVEGSSVEGIPTGASGDIGNSGLTSGGTGGLTGQGTGNSNNTSGTNGTSDGNAGNNTNGTAVSNTDGHSGSTSGTNGGSGTNGASGSSGTNTGGTTAGTSTGTGSSGNQNSGNSTKDADGSNSEIGTDPTQAANDAGSSSSSAGESQETGETSAQEVSAVEASAASAGTSARAYEVTKKQASKSAAQDSAISAGYIIAILGIAILFFVGFRRKSARFK